MYSHLESQLRNEGSSQPNDLTNEEVETLKRILSTDYKEVRDCINHRTYLESATDKVLIRSTAVNKIQNLYYISHPEGIPETNLNPETQMARWNSGIPLERVSQRALSMGGINFKGNPLDPSKYPHSSKGIHCDIETDTELIECTNMSKSTWMNNQIMNQKLGYFHKDDPQHKKLWIIITSYKNWGRQIDQAINQDKIHVIVLHQKIYKRNSNRNLNELQTILETLHQEGITNNLLYRIYQQNNRQYNIEHNTLYQLLTYLSPSIQTGVGVHISHNNKLEVGNLEPLIAG